MNRTTLIAFALCIMAQGASAQVMCGEQKHVVEALAARYGEHLAATGTIGPDGPGRAPAAFFINPETGSFTWLGISPDGMACIVFSGRDFKLAKPKPPGNPT